MLHKLQQQFYHAVPVWAQNELLSAWGYWLRRQRFGAEFRSRLQWLISTEGASAEEIQRYQDQQVERTIKHAYESVPYYRELMREMGLRPQDIRRVVDLVKLPVLSKSTVKEAPRRFLSSAVSRRDLIVSRTSGTTGTPLKIPLTRAALQFQWAVWWRHRHRFGLSLGDPFLVFGARLPIPTRTEKPPYWRHNRAINQTYLSTYHLTPRTMREIVAWLDGQQFAFYTGYPSAMYVLARFIRDNGLTLNRPPKHIVSASDALLPGFERTIAGAFGAPVTDQYGSAEACGNFARCELGKYHLDWEFCAVEFLPGGTPGPRLGRLVFTGFANPAMPLIRYDIGDVGELSVDKCGCGRSSLALDTIQGRTEDYVRTPDGRMVIGLNQVFEWADRIREAQVIQHSIEAIEVRVVPASGFSKRDLDALEYELRQRVGDALKITFETVDAIPRTPAGKFRAVISTVAPKTEEERQHHEAVVN